jgi:hypothetical protein
MGTLGVKMNGVQYFDGKFKGLEEQQIGDGYRLVFEDIVLFLDKEELEQIYDTAFVLLQDDWIRRSEKVIKETQSNRN